jgi:hypothetical protein
LLAVGAILLAALAGLTCGLALSSSRAAAALAEDPPGTTTTVPTTEPATVLTTTEPAPAREPPPKPEPKPAPRPKRKPAPSSSHPTTLPQTAVPTPVVQSFPSTKHPVRFRVKKKVHRKAALKHRATALPKISVQKSLVPVRLRGAQASDRRGAPDVGSMLIITSLALAIACFTIGAIPARAVGWRPAAIFVSERQVDLTVLGLALLIAASFMFFLTGGP